MKKFEKLFKENLIPERMLKTIKGGCSNSNNEDDDFEEYDLEKLGEQ